MKKRLLTMLLAAIMTVSFAGCSESTNNETDLAEDVSSTAEITTENTESIASKDVDTFNKKEKICDVEYCVPDYANEIKTSYESEYRGWRTNLIELSAREIKNTNISVHNDEYINQNKKVYEWENIKKTYIDNCEALYFEGYDIINEHKGIFTASVQINAPNGIVEFNITTFSIDNARAQYNEFIKHVTINNKTTTPSAKDAFNEKYGKLPTWKDVKYDPISYIGKNFIITDATCEIDDYYNYDYRGTEEKYFVFSAQPPGAYISDRLYIYADRTKFDWLFQALKEKRLKGSIVVKAEFKDSTKQGMATLVDTE